MQCPIVSFPSPSVNFRSRINLPWGSSVFCLTDSLRDNMKKWYSNGSPLKVWITISGADLLCNILPISPSKSLGNKALSAWASAAYLVLSHVFFENNLMVLLCKAFHASAAPLYDYWPFCGFNIFR